MKRIVMFLACLCLVVTCLCLLPTEVSAETVASGTCGDNLDWVLDDRGTLTISGTGDMGEWNPSTAIPWYDHREEIEVLVLEDGVTSIGRCAFYDCSNLIEISIPNSIISVGDSAFTGCTSLTRIILPCGLISIGSSAFLECISLKEITIPDSVSSIGNGAFASCSNLNYNVYENGKYLGNANNLYLCLVEATNKSITTASIHPQTKFICDFAFEGCNDLKEITIPDGVVSIAWGAFEGCTRLTDITTQHHRRYCRARNNARFGKGYGRCRELLSCSWRD